MPNRFTRVPDRPVPALPRLGRVLLPLADAFMVLMVSRPESGSLRATWVTPATLVLCVCVGLVGVPMVALTVGAGLAGGGPLALVAGAALLFAGSALRHRAKIR